MNYDMNETNYNELQPLSIQDKFKNIWYNYKKHIIIVGCSLLILIVLLIVLLSPKNPKLNNYSNIERIMILNAQNYVKNNNIKNNIYISLNNLNIKIDEQLNCETLSGVYKENETYVPYLMCDKYNSAAITQINEENKSLKEYAELNGTNPQIVNESTYQEAGTSSKDYQINIKGNDINNGLNFVTYYINDNGRNVGELKRIVIAENLLGTYPVLTLIGEKTKSISQGNRYIEQGYDAIDERDGVITNKVKVTGSVNTSNPGTYKLTYSVTNSRGKTSTATRIVVVNEKENVDLEITHKLDPSTVTGKSVTVIITVKGNGYQKIILPDNSENTSNQVSYTVYKNGTYDFIVYDKNNNSEVYSVKVSNIDDGVKAICSGEYENGYGLAKLSVKVTSGKAKNYKFLSDNKTIQSGTEDSYMATDDMTLLINPKVVITNNYGRDTTINCTVKHENYITYTKKGYYFRKGASMDSTSSVKNPYPHNGLSYYIHVPANVTADDKLPLIIGLHGGYGWGVPCGNPPSTTIEAYQTNHYYKSVWFYGKQTINNVSNPDVRAVIITPSNMSCGWESSVPSAIKILYAYIKLYNIDFDNIIITGTSQGGYGTLYTGFLEEHLIYIASSETSMSSIAAKYNTTVDEIVSYNNKIKMNIPYSDNKKTAIRGGGLLVIREKKETDQRSIFSMLVPMSPAKNDSRCSFTPKTIYDDTGKNCASTPPYSIKTPIWIISSNDEYSNIQKFAKELTAYYGPRGNIRYTVLTNLPNIGIATHNTQIAILGRTSANDWLLKQKYGKVDVQNDPELDDIEHQLGSNFAKVWHP